MRWSPLRCAIAAGIPVVALAAGGCSTVSRSYSPFDSTGYLRSQYAERVGAAAAAELTVPFELDDEIRAVAEETISAAGSERRRIDEILELVFGALDLRYSLVPTRSAVATYRDREGNCLSFVNLFVGLARQLRLNAFYVEVQDYQRWSYQHGTVVSHGHIVAGLRIDGELSTFDFLPYRPKSYRDFNPIDDLRSAAHYFNNLGAEALIAGRLEEGRRLLERAVALSPAFDKAQNNLGVALMRLGEAEAAAAILERGLASSPDSVPLLSNLARAYQLLGREKEALAHLSRIEELDQANPFLYVYRGERALAAGDLDQALEYMVKALRRETELPEVHLGLVKVYLALGEVDRARHHVERALKLDATHWEALKYAAMLAAREAAGGSAKSTIEPEGRQR